MSRKEKCKIQKQILEGRRKKNKRGGYREKEKEGGKQEYLIAENRKTEKETGRREEC